MRVLMLIATVLLGWLFARPLYMVRLRVSNRSESVEERVGYFLFPDQTRDDVYVSDFEVSQFDSSDIFEVEVLEDHVDMANVQGQTGVLADASDSAKEKAEAHGISVSSIEGTGSGGRVVVSDVDRTIEELGLELPGPHQNAPPGAVRGKVIEPHVETPDEAHDRLEVSRANINVEVPDTGRHVLEQHNPAPPMTHREIPDLNFSVSEVMPIADLSYTARHYVPATPKAAGNVEEGVAPPLGNYPERAEAEEETDLDPRGWRDIAENAGQTPYPDPARGSTRSARNLEARKALRDGDVDARVGELQAQEAETDARIEADREELERQQADSLGARDARLTGAGDSEDQPEEPERVSSPAPAPPLTHQEQKSPEARKAEEEAEEEKNQDGN